MNPSIPLADASLISFIHVSGVYGYAFPTMKWAQTYLVPLPGIGIDGVKDPPPVLVGTGVEVDVVEKVVEVEVVGLKAEARALPVKEEKNETLQSPPHRPFAPSPPQGVEHSESATFFP
jgi:hypothetical protein